MYSSRYCAQTTYTKPEKPGKKPAGGGGRLPSGWSETKDNAGATYYYNTKTGETTYTRPVSGPQIGKAKALTMAGGPAPPPSQPPAAQPRSSPPSAGRDRPPAPSTYNEHRG